MDAAVLQLAKEQARTNALLEALTIEVRNGFTRGSERMEEHHDRLTELEHEKTRARTLLRLVVMVASLSGLLTIWDRLAGWISS